MLGPAGDETAPAPRVFAPSGGETRFDTDDGTRFDTDGGSRFDTGGGSRFDTDGGSRFDTDGGSRFDTDGGSRFDTDGGSRFDTDDGSRFDTDDGSRFDTDDGSWRDTDGGSPFDADGESPFDSDVESIATSLGILRRLGGRRAAARSAALSMREYAVAEVVDLVASRGHSSPGEVAATLGLAQSRASVLVRRARQARWLDAEPGPWDARVTVVSVTDEGREIVELMQADRCTTVDRATVLWSDEDRASLAHLLGRFAEAVERPFRR